MFEDLESLACAWRDILLDEEQNTRQKLYNSAVESAVSLTQVTPVYFA